MIKKAHIDRIGLYYRALLNLMDNSPSPKMKMADPESAWSSLVAFVEQGRAVEVGDYLILFDTGCPWYSDKKHFFEELTIRFMDVYGNPVSDAVAAIGVLAKQCGASAIVVGDTQIGLMVKHYQADGYSVIGQQLFKDFSNGIRSETDGPTGPD